MYGKGCEIQNPEYIFSGFMMKQLHSAQCTECTAETGNQQKGSFRNPPELFLCFFLVCSVKHQSKEIDKQIIKQDIHINKITPPQESAVHMHG